MHLITSWICLFPYRKKSLNLCIQGLILLLLSNEFQNLLNKKSLMQIVDINEKSERKVVIFRNRLSIYRFPPLLVIHLKRFHYSSWRRDKLNTDVKFPATDLDLSSYTENSKEDESNTTYHLYGISHHSGFMSGGHYVADIKNVSGNGQWHH